MVLHGRLTDLSRRNSLTEWHLMNSLEEKPRKAESPIRIPPARSARVGAARAIPLLLEQFGVEPVSVAGLAPELLQDSDNIVSYAGLGRLVQTSVQRTRCEHFGLLMGQRGKLSSLGMLWLVIQSAPDVRSALRALVTHFHVHDRGAACHVIERPSTATVSYSIYDPGVEATAHMADCAMAIMRHVLQHLCGAAWAPSEIMLPRRTPRDIECFERFFGAPVRFNSQHAAIVFPAQWLNRKTPGADPDLHAFVKDRLDGAAKQCEIDFAEQIRRVVRTRLAYQRHSAEIVAGLFGIHRRTLSRRLASLGTSFDEIFNQVRFETARQLILDTDMPIGRIAAALEFSEASAFNRAFRRWSGCSPTDWREQHFNDGLPAGRLAEAGSSQATDASPKGN